MEWVDWLLGFKIEGLQTGMVFKDNNNGALGQAAGNHHHTMLCLLEVRRHASQRRSLRFSSSLIVHFI